jgi:hypothetical protein
VWYWILGGVVVVGLFYGFHRAALWAEGRGWIYYKTKRKPSGLGMSLVGQIYQPSIEHQVEEEQSQRIKADQDDSGDDPDSHIRIHDPDD